MTQILQRIVSFVTEEDDSEWKDVVHQDQWKEGDAWLERTLKPLGFKYRDMGCRGWEKDIGNRLVSVGTSTQLGKALVTLYYKTGTGRWQHDHSSTVEYGQEVLNKLIGWGFIR